MTLTRGQPLDPAIELEQLRKEIAVLRSELKETQDLLRIAPAFFGYVTPDGRVLGLNDLSVEVIEATRDQILGRYVWECLWWSSLPYPAARIRDAVNRAAAGASARFPTEYCAIRRGVPQIRWVMVEVQPILDADGKVSQIGISGIDITDQRQAEGALYKSQEQLARAVSVSRIGFFDWNMQANRVVHSDQMRHDWGIESTENRMEDGLARVHPEDRARLASLVREAIDAHRDLEAEYRVVRPDGKTIWIRAQGTVFYNARGEAVRFFGTSVDVSERREAEIALQAAMQTVQEERQILTRFLNAIPATLWSAQPDGMVDFINEYWTVYSGQALPAQPKELAWSERMHPEDYARVSEEWRTDIAAGRPIDLQFRLKRASDGEYRWHRSRGTPVRDAQGRVVKWAGYISDVHEETEALRSLQTEREIRERFVATLTHDLRTPLTAAKMSAQIISRRLDDLPGIQKSAERIVQSVERTDQMIQDLLDVHRIKAGEKLSVSTEAYELREVAAAVLEDLASVHGDRFILRVADPIRGFGSRDGLRRILENLCNNGIKYGAPDLPVTVTLLRQEGTAVIEVHNQGEAISPEDLPTLFDAFHRTPSAQRSGKRGWGLGLSLVRGIAEAQGGSVFVDSAPERGTTFRVILPLEVRN